MSATDEPKEQAVPIPPSKETLAYLEKMKDPEVRRTMWENKDEKK